MEYIGELISRYRKKYPESFNLHKFDLEDNELDSLKNVIKSSSFFKEIKFAIIKNPFLRPGFILSLIKDYDIARQKEIILLLYQAAAEKELKEKSNKLFNYLVKNSEVKEFKPLTSKNASRFVLSYLKKYRLNIKKEALDKLIQETDLDSWKIKNEIDKLAGYAKINNKRTIDLKMLSDLTAFNNEENIFNLVDSIFSNKARALLLFEDYISKGEDPLYILSMIAYQLKNLIAVKDLINKGNQYNQILKKTKLHPFVLRKTFNMVRGFELENLKKKFSQLENIELTTKLGADIQNEILKFLIS